MTGHGHVQPGSRRAAAPVFDGLRQHEGLVGAHRQEPPLQPLPEENERLLHQWQRPRLPRRVSDQTLDQRRFDVDANPLGRGDDRPPQPGLPQRQHLRPVGLDPRPQRRGHQLRVEVRADGQDNEAAVGIDQLPQGLLERHYFLGWSEGKQFFELVDDQQQPPRPRLAYQSRSHRFPRLAWACAERAGERGQRGIAGAHHADQPATGTEQSARTHRWDEAGEDERRLAGARGANDGEERVLTQPVLELLDFRLTAVEERGVRFSERAHPRVGAGRPRGGRKRGVIKVGQEPRHGRIPPDRVSEIETLEHRQPWREVDRLQEQGDDRPSAGLQSVGLGQDIDKRGVLVGHVGRRENEERPRTLLHRPFELEQAGDTGSEGGPGVDTHAGLFEGVEQVALDPRTIGLGE